MASFMRYYSTSIVAKVSALLKFITLSNMLRLRPSFAALSDFTVASSYLWSPASTSLLANWAAIQQDGSIDWAHSSITQTSNRLSGNFVWMN